MFCFVFVTRHYISLLTVQGNGTNGNGTNGDGTHVVVSATAAAVVGRIVAGPVGAIAGGIVGGAAIGAVVAGPVGAAVGGAGGAVIGGVSVWQLFSSNYLGPPQQSHILSLLYPDCWVVQTLSRSVLCIYMQS